MRWHPPALYAQVSECGRYSVCKIGGRDGYRYETWRTRAHPEGPHLVAHNLETADEAKRMAEADSLE